MVMIQNYTPAFNITFSGFDKRLQQQLICVLNKSMDLLENTQVNSDDETATVNVHFVLNDHQPESETFALNTRIICIGDFNDFENILSHVRNGYYGCVSASSIDNEIVTAVTSVLQKKVYISPVFSSMTTGYFQSNIAKDQHTVFTEQEHKLVQHLTAGALYKEIAWKMSISENTVRSHVRNIYGKLNVHSKTELAKKILGGHIITAVFYFLQDYIACLCY